MRTNITLLTVAIIAITVVSSCTRRADDAPYNNRLQLIATQSDFMASDSLDAVNTRATEAKFQTGDAVGVFIHTAGSVSSSGNHSANMKYLTLDAGAKWLAASGLSSPLNVGGTYYSTAYYPYKQGVANALAIDHSVESNQSATAGDKATNLEASDFMITDPSAITVKSAMEASVTLGFKHILTKLVLSVGVPSSIEGIAVVGVNKVTIKGLNPSCKINIATGAVSPTLPAVVTDITPRLSSGTGAAGAISTYEAIVVPQSVAPATEMVVFSCTMASGGDRELKYTTPAAAPLVLTSGSKITLTLSSSADLAFTSSLTLDNGDARTGLPLGVKAASGSTWSLTSSAAWLTVAKTAGGVYGASVNGSGTSSSEDIYVAVAANSGALAVPREATLTLTNNTGGTMSYKVVQNYTSFIPPTAAWNLSAGGSQSQAIAAFTTNQVWMVNTAGTGVNPVAVTVASSAAGTPLTLPHETIGALSANALFMQVAAANNTDAAKTGKVTFNIKGNTTTYDLLVTQAAPKAADFTTDLASATPATAIAWSSGNKSVTPLAGMQWKMSGDAGLTVSHLTAQTTAQTNVTVSAPVNNTNADKTYNFYLWFGSLTNTILRSAYAVTIPKPGINAGITTTLGSYAGASAASWSSAAWGVTSGRDLQWKTTVKAGSEDISITGKDVTQTASKSDIVVSVAANNTAAARTLYYYLNYGAMDGTLKTEYSISQPKAVVALDKAEQTALASATSATFNVTATDQKGVKFTVAKGTNAKTVSPEGEVTIDANGAYTKTITVTFDATTSAAKDITATVTYAGGTVLTHTIKQASAGPATVLVGGAKWTTGNLTGSAGTATGHKVEASPEGYGMFFRWGSLYVYQRESSSSDGAGWASGSSNYTRGSSTTPTTQSRGYDYVGLNGTNPGDPCQKLGSSYKTPTQTQWAALNNTGSLWSNYNNIPGRFFGPKASSCNNTTLQDGCIFIPASGCREWSTGTQSNQGSSGYYWSSSVYDSNSGWFCNFYSGGVGPENNGARSCGFSVRCVQE